MNLLSKRFVFWFLFSLLTVETLSFIGFFERNVAYLTFVLVALVALILTLKNLKYGLWFLAAELVIGSHGYLLYGGSVESGLSLRITLWLIVMAVWFMNVLFKPRSYFNYYKEIFLNSAYRKPLIGILLVLFISAILGYFNNENSLWLIEAKRWIFALILLPLLYVIRSRKDLIEIGVIILLSLAWSFFKTIFILYVFSHGFMPLMFEIYGWTRYSLLGEITRMNDGGFYRIFTQSHIFMIPAFLLAWLFSLKLPSIKNSLNLSLNKTWLRIIYGALVFSSMVIIVGLSRSFWLGLLGACLVTVFLLLIKYKPNLLSVIKNLGALLVTLVFSLLLLLLVVKFPFPQPTTEIDYSLLTDRVTKLDESAASARWFLLPVMWEGIKEAPLLGHGFGKTLTYYSTDPRVQESTVDGYYTTSAFEWGWLDIWLKTGLIGIFFTLWFIWLILKETYGLYKKSDNHEALIGLGLLGSTFALVVVHFFTPYLNHPLGMSYLIGLVLVLRVYNSK